MKVRIERPTHVLIEKGEVEVSEAEGNRLIALGARKVEEKKVKKGK